MAVDGRHSPTTYVLEHLATFTVSHDNDLVYPADGMRRLLAMEKTNGIWTQKMLMKIDDRQHMVNIIDQENKEIVERFPLHLIREPTAFTSNDPKEMYNNILIYVVGHEQQDDGHPPAEMHIFQCNNVRARDVVEDIKSFTAGGQYGQRRRSSSDYQPTYDAYDDEEGVRLQAQLQDVGDAVSSVSSGDKYEMDVAVLNKCFDDIEKFIARLQNAASAFQELEKRRRSRKTKKKDLGDGMLQMRAKPPPEEDFVDVFQKFKLSFNLLAKLKSHIHDPNAPELVHFLFTPLALIVDASHDSHYGPDLPSKVVAPLLSGEAVDLLVNCLTSKESELWHSLGDTWYVASEEWKGSRVPPFAPVFADGWRPRLGSPQEHGDLPPEGRLRSDDDEASHEDDGGSGREWADGMVGRGLRIVRVTFPRTANNEKELTVVRGEFLEVLDDSRKWWRARNGEGVIGHVPHTIVTPYEPSLTGRERRNSGGSSSRKAELRYF